MPVNAACAGNLHRPCTETDQNEIDGDVRKGRTGTGKRGLGLAVPAKSGHAKGLLIGRDGPERRHTIIARTLVN